MAEKGSTDGPLGSQRIRRALAVALVGFVALLMSQPVAGTTGSATELLREAGGAVQYALVFVLAAIPWLEILVVIPIGVGLGLDAVGVAVFAFLGNVLPIYGIIAFYARFRDWLERRRESDGKESTRHERARAIWERYGLPGLAIASPIVTGVHLAAVIALAVGSSKRSVGVWMTASIAVWTVVLTAGAYYGFEFITGLG